MSTKLILGLASLILGVNHIKTGLSEINSPRRQPQRPPQRGPKQGLGRVAPKALPSGDKRKPTVTEHTVHSLPERIKHIQARVRKGKLHPDVIYFARKAITQKCGQKWCIDEKNNLAESKAIFEAVRANVRYTSDPLGVDLYAAPERTLETKAGDCFPQGTLLLTDKHEFVPVEKLKAGQRIWGKDRWSEVTNVWFKGERPTTLIKLNNGSQMRLTDDHKVYVSGDGGEFTRISVAALQEGAVLLQPEFIDCFPRGPVLSLEGPLRAFFSRVAADSSAWQLRVKSIEREVVTEPVWDISTDDHYVYLPEHDVTVSNCDDIGILLASAHLAVGIPFRFKVIQTVDSPEPNHIYGIVGLPRANPKRWIAVDGSLAKPYGWEAPASMVAKKWIFPAE